jgi:hypothetical protein
MVHGGSIPKGVRRERDISELEMRQNAGIVDFKIISANYESEKLGISNNIFGPGYHRKTTGVIPCVTFAVQPYNSEIPTDKIIFNGFTHLERGDSIRAYIQRDNEDESIGILDTSKGPYRERDFREEETVRKIEKLNPNNLEEVLATFEC